MNNSYGSSQTSPCFPGGALPRMSVSEILAAGMETDYLGLRFLSLPICVFYQCVGTLLAVSEVICSASLGLLAAACYRDRWGQRLDRHSIHHTVYVPRDQQDFTYSGRIGNL